MKSLLLIVLGIGMTMLVIGNSNLSFAQEEINFGPGKTYYLFDTPLKQFKSGIKPEEVQCNTGFQLILKGSDNSPACIKDASILDFLDRSWATKTMSVENSNQTLSYSMVGGSITESKKDTHSTSLILSINARTNGTLAITIPRALLDTVKNNGINDRFYVLTNGQETSFTETHTTITDRTLSIPFQNDTSQIEIIAIEII